MSSAQHQATATATARLPTHKIANAATGLKPMVKARRRKEALAQIVFPVTRTQQKLRVLTGYRVHITASVRLAAALQEVVTHTFKVLPKTAPFDIKKKKTIKPKHVSRTLAEDPALRVLRGEAIVQDGGTVPLAKRDLAVRRQATKIILHIHGVRG